MSLKSSSTNLTNNFFVFFLQKIWVLFCFSLLVSHGKGDLKAHASTMTWSVGSEKSEVTAPCGVWFVLPFTLTAISPSTHQSYVRLGLLCCECVAVRSGMLPSCETHESNLREIKIWKDLWCSLLRLDTKQPSFSLKCVKTYLTWLAEQRDAISIIYAKTDSQLCRRYVDMCEVIPKLSVSFEVL